MDKKAGFLLVVILIIAGFMHFYHLGSTPPGLYPDEAMNGNDALRALHTGDFQVFYESNNGREGLYANTQAMLLAATGVREPWVLRLTSALFGFFTVLATFFLARELFHSHSRREAIALLAAFFLATSFWHVNFARIGFRAIMASFFLAWGLYFLLRGIRAQNGRSGIWLAAAGGAFFGLGFHSYISYRILPLLLLLFIPFFRGEKFFWRRAFIFAAVAVLMALPLGLYFLENPESFLGRTSQVSVFSSENPALTILKNSGLTIGMLDWRGDMNWRHNFAGRPQLFWPVGIVFWIGVILGLAAVLSRNRPGGDHEKRSLLRFAYLVCFAWIALAALPVVFSNEGIPHALRAILMIPPVMILAAAGAAWLYDRVIRNLPRHRTRLVQAAAAVILSLLALEGAYTYFIAWGRSPHVAGAFSADYVEIGRDLRELPQETHKYVIVRAGGVTTPLRDPWDPSGRTVGIPVPAQTMMFMTDTYLPERQLEENIHYVLPSEEDSIPAGAYVFEIN